MWPALWRATLTLGPAAVWPLAPAVETPPPLTTTSLNTTAGEWWCPTVSLTTTLSMISSLWTPTPGVRGGPSCPCPCQLVRPAPAPPLTWEWLALLPPGEHSTTICPVPWEMWPCTMKEPLWTVAQDTAPVMASIITTPTSCVMMMPPMLTPANRLAGCEMVCPCMDTARMPVEPSSPAATLSSLATLSLMLSWLLAHSSLLTMRTPTNTMPELGVTWMRPMALSTLWLESTPTSWPRPTPGYQPTSMVLRELLISAVLLELSWHLNIFFIYYLGVWNEFANVESFIELTSYYHK